MRETLIDIRYAWRQLWHARAFFATAVMTLGLGIAASTALFGVVNGFVFKLSEGMSLDLVSALNVVDSAGRRRPLPVSPESLRAFDTQQPDAIAAVSGSFGTNVMVRQIGRAERLSTEPVSAGYARVYRPEVQAGRWIGADDDRAGFAARVAVVSDRVWRQWLGGRPEAIGSAVLRVNGLSFTVIGVAAPSVRGLTSALSGDQTDLWLPLESPPGPAQRVIGALVIFVRWHGVVPGARDAERLLEPMVRDGLAFRETQERAVLLRNGRSIDERALAARMELAPASEVLGFTTVTRWGIAIVLIGTLVLLAACANYANLLHARSSQRTGEVAIRLSLGASRWRVLRLVAAESAIVAAIASVVGLVLSMAATRLFTSAFPAIGFDRTRPVLADLATDWRVIAFAFGAGAFAAATVGLASAWRLSRAPVQTIIAASGAAQGQTSRGARGLRTTLVALQVTVAVVLVMAAGTWIEDLLYTLEQQGLRGRRVRYDAAQIITAGVHLRSDLGDDYNEPRARQFYERVVAEVSRLPGVDAVGVADRVPGGFRSNEPGSDFLELTAPPEGASGHLQRGAAGYVRVSPGFLRVLNLPLLRGRDIGPNDADSAPLVAVISESAAAAMWPGLDPIGRQLRYRQFPAITVVGVSADPVTSIQTSEWERPSNFVYFPLAQHHQGQVHIVLRSQAPLAQIEPLRRAVASVNDQVALIDPTTIEEGLLRWSSAMRATVALVTALGAVSLAIAMLGVYGVISFFVSTRTREIGIRSALGATPGRVLKMVVDQAIHIVLVGLLSGVLVATLGTRVVLATIPRLMPAGITPWVVVPILILVSGVLAGYLPARRAARIDPNVALREL